MSRPALRRTAAVVAVLVLGDLALTGCTTGPSDAQWSAYTDSLGRIPGVTVVESTTTQSLPFSRSGNAELDLAPSAATLKKVEAAYCPRIRSIGGSIELTMAAESVRVKLPVCATPRPSDLPALASAAGATGATLQIDIVSTDGAYSVDPEAGTAAEPPFPSVLAVARAIEPRLDGPIRRLGDHRIVLAAHRADWAGYLDDAIAVDAATPLSAVAVQKDAVFLSTAAAPPPTTGQVRALLGDAAAARYRGIDLAVTSGVDGFTGVGVAAVTLQARIAAAHPDVHADVQVGAVHAVAATPDDLRALSREIAAENPDRVPVRLSLPVGDVGAAVFDVQAFTTGGFPALAPSRNPYPRWMDEWERLNGAGATEMEVFPAGGGLLELRCDVADAAALTTVARSVAKADGYAEFSVNGRSEKV